MYFTNDSMLPENQQPLIITVAPYGPQWLPSDYPEDIPVTWEQQTQKAVDCYNAGATVLHFHVRDPKTGHGSKNFNEFNEQIARVRKAVPKMLIQVGGSISFAPEPGKEAHWLGYDTRHMLTELNPKPDQVTIAVGTTQMNILDLTTPDDVQGTQLANPAMQAAYQNMVADATPEFYVEHLKRLRKNGVQPMFAMAPRPHPRSDRASHPHRRVHGAAESHHDGNRRRGRLRPQSLRLYGVGASLSPRFRCDVRVVVADGGAVRGHGGCARHPHPGWHRRQSLEPQGCAHDLRATGRTGGANREGAGPQDRNWR
jgi:hypothetical protein